MPGKSGHEVLQTINENRDLRQIPVAVLASSTLDTDMAESYGLGSNHFWVAVLAVLGGLVAFAQFVGLF